ncbi:hypothetical protein [Halothece sp. PCC 7418]|uniref:hypothetical protein n=1 Tax=Halothece sp. (strain PCC 7418) TaxID=65093 RepID=UPI0002E9DC54|nr:hypothetical protein [Halothece sp. PCC 7418]
MRNPTWEDLPEGVISELEKLMSELPHPSSYLTVLKKEVRSALKAWKAKEAANHLVILGSPVSPLTELIVASLSQQPFPELEVVYPFSDYNFRHDSYPKKQHLKMAIEGSIQKSESIVFQSLCQSHLKMIVIPDLEQYFLRCISGWEGMIWLREKIVQTDDCFWLLGCNNWSWIFLDYVCQLNAYLETTQNLPKLSSDELQQWLQPMVESFIPEETTNPSSFFWETLGSLSRGESEIAKQLWLQSIQMSFDQDLTENAEERPRLKLITPRLPNLPSLSADDRYLLHSLLLHGKITRSSLALSLGVKEEKIQGRIQLLLRDDLIQQRNGLLSVTPLHYPKIKQELSQNNFLIGEDE